MLHSPKIGLVTVLTESGFLADVARGQIDDNVSFDSGFSGTFLVGANRASGLEEYLTGKGIECIRGDPRNLVFVFGAGEWKCEGTLCIPSLDFVCSIIPGNLPLLCGGDFMRGWRICAGFGEKGLSVAWVDQKRKLDGPASQIPSVSLLDLLRTIRPPATTMAVATIHNHGAEGGGESDLDLDARSAKTIDQEPQPPPPSSPGRDCSEETPHNTHAITTQQDFGLYTTSTEEHEILGLNGLTRAELVKIHETAHSAATRMTKFVASTVKDPTADFRKTLGKVCTDIVWHCEICRKFGHHTNPGTSIRPPVSKNFRGWVDAVTLSHSDHRLALVIVDEGTRDVAIGLLQGEEAEDYYSAYMIHWAAVHGPHQTLLSDGGGGLASDKFRAMLSDIGTVKLKGPGRSSASFGLVERVIETIRHHTDRLSADPGGPKTSQQWQVALAITANSLRNEIVVGDSTASERSVGSRTSLHSNTSLTSTSHNMSHLQLLKIKEATQRSFYATINSDKLRAKLKEKSTRAEFRSALNLTNCSLGDLVEYLYEPQTGRGATWRTGRVMGLVPHEESLSINYAIIETAGNPVSVNGRDIRPSSLIPDSANAAWFAELFDNKGRYIHPNSSTPQALTSRVNTRGGEKTKSTSVPRVVSTKIKALGAKETGMSSKNAVRKERKGNSAQEPSLRSRSVVEKDGPAQPACEKPSVGSGTTKTQNDVEVGMGKVVEEPEPEWGTHTMGVCCLAGRQVLLDCVEGGDEMSVQDRADLLQGTPMMVTLLLGKAGEPEPEPSGLTAMDAYGHSWDELPEEERVKARLKALADYHDFNAWDTNSDLTDDELKALMLKDKRVVSIRCGWVDKVKVVNGRLIGKCRLVPKGFQDRLKHTEDNSSPTVKQTVMRVYEVLGMREEWEPFAMDFSSAFFQSTELLSRPVYIELPEEERSWQEGRGELKWRKLLVSVPGMNNAPRAWYETISKFFIEHGFVRSTFDPAMFMCPAAPGSDLPWCGYVPLHVDDSRGRGTPEFLEWIEKITVQSAGGRFKVGEFVLPKVGETNEFTGKAYTETADGIVIDQDKYCSTKLVLVDTSWEEGSDELLESYRSSLGACQWAIQNSQFDQAYEVNRCAQKTGCLTKPDCHALNKTAKAMQDNPLHMFVPRLRKDIPVRVTGIVDAGMSDVGTWEGGQVAYFIGLQNAGLSLIAHCASKSGKIKRVASGSFPAETLSAYECNSAMLNVQGLVYEFTYGTRIPIREQAYKEFMGVTDVKVPIPMDMYSDSLGLVQNVTGSFDRSNFSSQRIGDLAAMRQSVQEDDLEIHHINGKTNPIDSQTKIRNKCLPTYALYRLMLETGTFVPDLSDEYTGHKLPRSGFGKKKKGTKGTTG